MKQKSHSRAHRQQSTSLAQPPRDALQPHALGTCSLTTSRDGVAETPFKGQPRPRRTQPRTQPHRQAFSSPYTGAQPPERSRRQSLPEVGKRHSAPGPGTHRSVPRVPGRRHRTPSRRVKRGVSRAQLTDSHHPHRPRLVDRRHRIRTRRNQHSHRRLARIASVRRHHVVRPCAPIDSVRQDAPRTVIELQRERHRRGRRIHRRQRPRRGEPAQPLTPRIRQAQHRRRRRPTHFGRRLRRFARIDVPAHRRRRRSRAIREIRRPLPIHHLIAIDRLTIRGDGPDRDRDRRPRRGTGVTRQRENPDERRHSRRS
jgi:hypothetical protein